MSDIIQRLDDERRERRISELDSAAEGIGCLAFIVLAWLLILTIVVFRVAQEAGVTIDTSSLGAFWDWLDK